MSGSSSHFDPRVDELFADFLVRCEEGEPVDFEALCRENVDQAHALRALKTTWEGLESVRRLVGESGRSPDRSRRSEVDLGEASVRSGSSPLLDRLREQAPRGTRYRIEGEIARGGMGAILKIWDDELRRALAMKIVLGQDQGPSGETPQVDPKTLGRFLEEAQITGQLDHPGIVPVHELGLDSTGRVYFTMRLVRGEDLRTVFAHVKSGRDGWSQVRALGVLLKVCEAMSYAHAKSVIHRDLKPANVMVGKFGEVYVMDWGLARVLGREDKHDLRIRPQEAPPSAVHTERHEERDQTPDSPLVTMDGTVVGTPCYMPPEQAKGLLGELGPHSDVYSIGAMLYQLVSGEMPYVPSDARMSRRTILAAVVKGPPERIEDLAPRTPPELVAILEKAMAREIGARYPTTLDLAQDLRAYLEGRVVAAYETGAWAETKKWVQRNKPLAGSLAAAVLAIVAGVIAFAVKAGQATRAAERANLNAGEARASEARAKKVTELVQKALVGSDPNQGGSQQYRVVDAMDAAIGELESGALENDPETEAALQATISVILLRNGRPVGALSLAEQALATRQRLLPGDHPDVATSLSNTALCLESLGRSDEALPRLEAVLEMYRRLFPGEHPDVATSLDNVATCLERLGRSAEALPKLEMALEMHQRIFRGDHEHVATSLNNVAACLESLGRSSDALPKYEAALEMRQRLFEGDHPAVAAGLDSVGFCLESLGRSAEALRKHEAALDMHRRLFEGDHPSIASSLNNVAACLESLGRSAEALPVGVEALEMLQRILPGDHPNVAKSLNNTAHCLYTLGRSAEALPKFEAASEMRQRLFPEDHPDVAASLNNLAGCLQSLGRNTEALPRFEAALEMYQRLYPGDHPSVATGRNNVAYCLQSLGRSAEALPEFEAALEMLERLFPGDHPEVATSFNNVAICLKKLGQISEALPLYVAALEMRERLYEGDHPEVATSLNNMASCLGSLGRSAEALPYAERAQAMAERVFPEGHPSRVSVETVLELIRASLSK